MLKYAIGFGHTVVEAQNQAAEYYNEVEGRKTVHTVQTLHGYDTEGKDAWVTSIWFTLLPPVEEKKPEQKFEFIGSTAIDPNDPNWREKWEAAKDPTDVFAHIADQ